jgi:threonine aldolase
MEMSHKSFASDNYSGVHPEIMSALQRANHGHAPSYGADDFTKEAISKFKSIFGDNTEVFFVYNGTGANILGLSSITRPFNSILCAELAHINVDESTGPEKFTGCKLIAVPAINGKLTADHVEAHIHRKDDQHHPQAKVISISQATEYGTLYTVEEVRALSVVARKHGLWLHMDGSRISNAAAGLHKAFREFTVDAGVDVLSFGGTKNGMMFGEAVLFFNPELAREVRFIRKQEMQLHSKMRFISAQFMALLSDELWLRNATHSNRMARLFESQLRQVSGVKITQPVEANSVFAIFPQHVIEPMQKEFFFYIWTERTNEVRLMCSFDTTEEEIGRFTSKLKSLI